jgi:hypothetical protein
MAGLLFKDYIDLLLENVLVVGVMLFLGRHRLPVIDRWAPGGTIGWGRSRCPSVKRHHRLLAVPGHGARVYRAPRPPSSVA